MGEKKYENEYSVDDKGNEAIFYEREPGFDWERAAVLDMEAGPEANEPAWHNFSGAEVEMWARDNGYNEDITEAKNDN